MSRVNKVPIKKKLRECYNSLCPRLGAQVFSELEIESWKLESELET